MNKLIFFVATASLIGGCAFVDDKTTTEDKAAKQFMTGSNLPQRDRTKSGVLVVSPESMETTRNTGTALSAPRTN